MTQAEALILSSLILTIVAIWFVGVDAMISATYDQCLRDGTHPDDWPLPKDVAAKAVLWPFLWKPGKP